MVDQGQPEYPETESSYKDIELQCIDCPKTFTFSAGEQEFFARNNYVQPKRCPDCRAAKKRRMANRDHKPFRRPPEDTRPY